MNTHSDTDEGKPRPSVWPVYVASGIIAVVGALGVLVCFVIALSFPTIPPEKTWALIPGVAYMGLCGAFSLVSAIGTILLRPWAWWLATVWGYLVGLSGFAGLLDGAHEILFAPEKSPLNLHEGLDKSLLLLALGAFVVWVLKTRRQLFFQPKPEGEE